MTLTLLTRLCADNPTPISDNQWPTTVAAAIAGDHAAVADLFAAGAPWARRLITTHRPDGDIEGDVIAAMWTTLRRRPGSNDIWHAVVRRHLARTRNDHDRRAGPATLPPRHHQPGSASRRRRSEPGATGDRLRVVPPPPTPAAGAVAEPASLHRHEHVAPWSADTPADRDTGQRLTLRIFGTGDHGMPALGEVARQLVLLIHARGETTTRELEQTITRQRLLGHAAVKTIRNNLTTLVTAGWLTRPTRGTYQLAHGIELGTDLAALQAGWRDAYQARSDAEHHDLITGLVAQLANLTGPAYGGTPYSPIARTSCTRHDTAASLAERDVHEALNAIVRWTNHHPVAAQAAIEVIEHVLDTCELADVDLDLQHLADLTRHVPPGWQGWVNRIHDRHTRSAG